MPLQILATLSKPLQLCMHSCIYVHIVCSNVAKSPQLLDQYSSAIRTSIRDWFTGMHGTKQKYVFLHILNF